MTKSELTDAGETFGQEIAERIYTSVTPFDRLPSVLDEYSKRERWSRRFDTEWRYVGHRYGKLNTAETATFKKGFISGGLEGIKGYIKELKEEGLIKERRRR